MTKSIRLSGLATAVLAAVSCSGSPPGTLGPTPGGGLAPCPETPNCVHTGDRHPDGTEPLRLSEAALDRSDDELLDLLAEELVSLPRTTLADRDGGWVHAESRSRVFRFVDDVEILLPPDFREDETPEVLVRSASRLGRSDLGVNADRVDALRSRLLDRGLLIP